MPNCKEIVKKQSICMMVTATEEQTAAQRHARGQRIDRGVFWFLTLRTSEKFEELTLDPRISLYFANPGKQEYLAVHGHTTVSNDRARMKELFSPLAKAWVPEGAEDPDLRFLVVTPDESATTGTPRTAPWWREGRSRGPWWARPRLSTDVFRPSAWGCGGRRG